SIAVIGASETPGSVGKTLLRNLIQTPFGGAVFPVNPKRNSVMGIKAYPNLAAIPDAVDLAIIATPAAIVPALVCECGAAGVKGAVIVSAGFKEIGAPGIALEQEILTAARQSGLRIIGPNCLGLMNPHSGLNATFASAMARPGNVGFISQSGALCTSILDWSFRENVGFSAFISIGSMLDVGWGDLIYYLGDDPQTQSIVIYMESIGNARSFLSAAREVALTKPIIVIKAGRTEAAAKASASHTGAMTGSDDVLNAAFRRCGVLRVTRISELFNMAEVLAKQPRPKGPRLTIITNAGGPGVLATDMLATTGGELADLSAETLAQLDAALPPFWSHSNPVDILGDATPERYLKTVDAVLQDPNSDGALVILTPQAMTEPTQIAEQLKDFIGSTQQNGRWSTTGLGPTPKPILASWMGGAEVMAGEAILNSAKIPTYPYPDSAARVFTYMWQSSYNLKALYETPSLAEDWDGFPPEREVVATLLDQAQGEGRTLLTEVESKQILAAYHLPTVPTVIAQSAAEAIACAQKIGFPVVLKLWSTTITHKTDVGGVQLNLGDAEAVRRAFEQIAANVRSHSGSEHFQGVTVQPMIDLHDSYELIIGSSIDPQFGPILLFGSGGQLVEVYQDRAIALPPLNTTLAQRMMEQTQIFKALKGVRGRAPVDLDALAKLLVQFSQLVVEQRWIKEIEINPLLVSANSQESPFLALDARVILHDPSLTLEQLPKLAIRPYPIQYVGDWTMKDGSTIKIRPIRPEDEPLAVQFHQTLSEQSVYFRYFHLMKLSQRTAHERLMRLCFIDYDREMALVADYKNPDTGNHEMIAVGRLSKLHGVNEAEFSLLVSDRYQRQGLGTELLRRLLDVARDEKLTSVSAQILPENTVMQRVCEKVGFTLKRSPRLTIASIQLS
ncbi:MAG: bifunctional acetate--CoA ligase family protein/GNAT family N-acetyltransferase, partial [Thermosynechococcaceae cyanobacterium]